MTRANASARRDYAPRSSALSRYLAPVGVTISVVLALIGFFLTHEDHAVLKGLISLGIGLLGTSVTLQLELLLRVQERNKAWDAYGGLLRLIEEEPHLLPLFAEATRASVRTLEQSKIDLFKEQVPRLLHEVSIRLDELSQGRWRCPPGGMRLFEHYYKCAESTVLAVTDERDIATWWSSATGRYYLELNRESPAEIKRIVILGGADQNLAMEMIYKNTDAGVEMYAVRREQLGEPNLLVNITMFDDILMHQDIVNTEGRTVAHQWSENRVDLQRAHSRFSGLMAYATRYPPDAKPSDETRASLLDPDQADSVKLEGDDLAFRRRFWPEEDDSA
jgi:hypothetical protein